jgi:hypothetical protein
MMSSATLDLPTTRAGRPVSLPLLDARGCAVSGATPEALPHFEQALAAFQAWRGGAEEPLARALERAPGFVTAHALRAHLLICSRDPQRIGSAAAALGRSRPRQHAAHAARREAPAGHRRRAR